MIADRYKSSEGPRNGIAALGLPIRLQARSRVDQRGPTRPARSIDQPHRDHFFGPQEDIDDFFPGADFLTSSFFTLGLDLLATSLHLLPLQLPKGYFPICRSVKPKVKDGHQIKSGKSKGGLVSGSTWIGGK